MRFIERKVLEVLLEKAADLGYYPARITAVQAEGEDGATVTQDRMQHRVIKEHVDAWDSDSLLTFEHVEDPSSFWVYLVWGNGTDVISDYGVHPDSETIMDAVYAEIEEV